MRRKKIRIMLNKREYELYMAIKNYIEKHNYSPSYRELLNLCSYKSISSIMETLIKLEDLGFIITSKNKNGRIKSRTIRVVYTSDIRKELEKIEKNLEIL